MTGRPGVHDKRTATAIRFKPETHARVAQAALERDLSINYIVNRAVEEFLDRLIPADEVRWTQTPGATS
jgi:predicted transcriptional regulator